MPPLCTPTMDSLPQYVLLLHHLQLHLPQRPLPNHQSMPTLLKLMVSIHSTPPPSLQQLQQKSLRHPPWSPAQTHYGNSRHTCEYILDHFYQHIIRAAEMSTKQNTRNMQFSGVPRQVSSACLSPTMRRWKILGGIQERDDAGKKGQNVG
jgi:hypothetical protein